MYKELNDMVKIKFPPFHFSYLWVYDSSGLSYIKIRNGRLINVETLFILIEMLIQEYKNNLKQNKQNILISLRNSFHKNLHCKCLIIT